LGCGLRAVLGLGRGLRVRAGLGRVLRAVGLTGLRGAGNWAARQCSTARPARNVIQG
jgi:hypothetical protein